MDLSYLKDLNKEDFETERNRLLANAILAAPRRRLKKLVHLQSELNALRDKMSSEEFIQHCVHQTAENMENIADLAAHISYLGGTTPPPRDL